MKKTLITALIAGMLSLTPDASNAEDKPKEAPTQSLFTGSVISGEEEKLTLDNIADYRNNNGAQVTIENFDTPYAEGGEIVNTGLRTPWIADTLRVSTAIDTVPKSDLPGSDTWAYTAFLEGKMKFAGLDLLLRTGGFQNSKDLLGGFVGGKLVAPIGTIDFDSYMNKSQVELIGFASGIIPIQQGNIYLGFGGRTDDESIHLVEGYANPGGFGLFTKTDLDLKNDSQKGKVQIVPTGSVYSRETFDFKNHVFNGTEMQRVATGGILNGWPPFDGFAVDGIKGNWQIWMDWSNSQQSVSARGELLYRATPGLMFGLGGGNVQDKTLEKNMPIVFGELYAAVPGTPLEGWLRSDYDLKTGKISPQAYVGLIKRF